MQTIRETLHEAVLLLVHPAVLLPFDLDFLPLFYRSLTLMQILEDSFSNVVSLQYKGHAP
jgi:hypothetical protein